LALEVLVEAGEVQLIARDAAERPTSPPASSQTDASSSQYENAYELESDDPAVAIKLYLACLASNSQHRHARLNCGRLLHMTGRLAEAEQMYREAPEPDGTLLFNLAVLLEDLGRAGEAMEAYQQALELDPGLADAHFNLARLHELAGNRRESFRHLLAYKRAGEH
jgi:tetratricopeptide (TPR) repeat protein